jgi:histidinol-phosphatase (PHP family)
MTDGAPDGISFDYHSHHRRCGHAAGEMADYIEAALALGLSDFGVSDHGPAYWLPGDHDQPGTQMAVSELPRYVAEAHDLKARYDGRIAVRVGVEADYIPGREDDLRALLDGQDFDYVLGSVHYARGRNVFDRSRWATEDAAETYADYYRQVIAAAGSGLFDILSHLTVVEAFGPPVPDELAARLYPPVADAVAAGRCAVEVNTSGYRKMGGDEPFPNRRMLRLLIERGVPLTFGSDCHKPEEVGFGRDRALNLLAELGINTSGGPTPVTARRGPILAYATHHKGT